MSTSRRRRTLISAAAWTLCFGELLLGGEVHRTAMPNTVPAAVQAAARANVMDLAAALAHARVSAGFQILEADFKKGVSRAWHLSWEEHETVTLQEVLTTFATVHPEYEWRDAGGLPNLTNRRGKLIARPILDQRVRRFQLSSASLYHAMVQAQRIVNATVVEGQGIVASIASDPDVPTPALPREPLVSVDVADATLVEALNAVAKAAPGLVWVLTLHTPQGPLQPHYTLSYHLPGGLSRQFHDELR